MADHADAPAPSNPLVDCEGLPPFDRIRAEHVEPAVDRVLAEARDVIASLLEPAGCFTWNTLVAPLERVVDRVGRVWAPVRHLHAVVDDDDLRAAYHACLAKISRFHVELRQHPGLYAAYRRIAAAEYRRLDATRRKAVDDGLRDFRLAGVELDPAARRRLAVLETELAAAQARFADNVRDATRAWQKHVRSPEGLAGLGPEARAMARRAAERAGLDGWLLELEPPIHRAVMAAAEDRALRAEMYAAWATRASDQGPHAGRWDNGPVVAAIVARRQEQARLLGYRHYAELALATRMAASPDQVLDFLDRLARRALAAARAELGELRGFAADRLGIAELRPWDVAHAAERLRRDRFGINAEALRPYFPATRVLTGLFRVAGRIFGIAIERVDGVAAWHGDVGYYRVVDADGSDRGGFYLDLYARRGKRGGAWTDECMPRMRRADGSVRSPVAFLGCNLSPPADGGPALLRHDEVVTLFHEFGHVLHQLLTGVEVPSLAGVNGVEWDAVELPSQLMENWCWERESLDLVAAHVDTGEPLPADLLSGLQRSRRFHAGLGLLRQLELALFDFRLHAELDRPTVDEVQALLSEVRDAVCLVRPPPWDRFAHAFTHVFAGPYAAGYYGYKWAQGLSADAFEAFRAAGVLDPATGAAFRHAVLEPGGSRPALESFRAFRGRDPDPEALLRQAGLPTDPG